MVPGNPQDIVTYISSDTAAGVHYDSRCLLCISVWQLIMKETPILPQAILQPWNGLTVMITGLLNQPLYFWGLPEFAFTSRLTASSPVIILQYFKKYNFVFI